MESFWLLSDPNVRWVVLGSVALGIGAAITGAFAFLRKQSLVGDALSHAVLPGVCAGFLIAGTKNPYWMLAGAIASGWISLLIIDYLQQNTRVKSDAAIAIVLSAFFALGLTLITVIQHMDMPDTSGLENFLFGRAASLTIDDVILFFALAGVVVAFTITFLGPLRLITFDPAYAKSIGLPVNALHFTLTTLTVVSVALGIQAVGVVLMAALLITPAAAARFWTHKLEQLLVISAVFGALAGYAGSLISYSAPRIPTGPWVVIFLTIVAIVSVIVAPKRGVIARWKSRKYNRRKISDENTLKAFYHLYEEKRGKPAEITLSRLLQQRDFHTSQLMSSLKRLRKRSLLVNENGHWSLTEYGVSEAQRIVRLHRLWELYLSRRLNLPADHVHDTAEAMEHVITPEVEEMLERELDDPILDPHLSQIPKKS